MTETDINEKQAIAGLPDYAAVDERPGHEGVIVPARISGFQKDGHR